MIEHLLTHTLTLYRPSTTVDPGGGHTVTYTVVGPVRAKVNQPTPAEVQAGMVWGARLTHVVHCLYGEDIRRGDELGGDLPSDVPPDNRLRVLAVISDSHQTYKRVECTTVQVEPASAVAVSS